MKQYPFKHITQIAIKETTIDHVTQILKVKFNKTYCSITKYMLWCMDPNETFLMSSQEPSKQIDSLK